MLFQVDPNLKCQGVIKSDDVMVLNDCDIQQQLNTCINTKVKCYGTSIEKNVLLISDHWNEYTTQKVGGPIKATLFVFSKMIQLLMKCSFSEIMIEIND